MNWENNIPIVNNLSIITQYTEIYPTGTTTAAYTQKTVIHVPFFSWLILSTLFLFVMKRIIKEFIIRWRAQ